MADSERKMLRSLSATKPNSSISRPMNDIRHPFQAYEPDGADGDPAAEQGAARVRLRCPGSGRERVQAGEAEGGRDQPPHPRGVELAERDQVQGLLQGLPQGEVVAGEKAKDNAGTRVPGRSFSDIPSAFLSSERNFKKICKNMSLSDHL